MASDTGEITCRAVNQFSSGNYIIGTNGKSYWLKESRRRLKHRLRVAVSVAERNDATPES